MVHDEIKLKLDGEEHHEHCRKVTELKLKLADVQSNLQSYFEPYIGFGDFRVEPMKKVSK